MAKNKRNTDNHTDKQNCRSCRQINSNVRVIDRKNADGRIEKKGYRKNGS